MSVNTQKMAEDAKRIMSDLDAAIEKDLREICIECHIELGDDEELIRFLMARWRVRAMEFRAKALAEVEKRIASLH